MNRPLRVILALVALVVVVGAAAVIFIVATGGSGEASTEITSESVSAANSATIFAIVADDSEVRFVLDEDLRGVRTTVTGVTNQVAGEIAVDFSAPQNSEVGPIRINVRTLATDNDFRNRAIRGQILRSSQDEFEFAEFVPTAIEGLPETVTVGTPITFTVTGDFTLVGVTQPVTFELTVTPVSETRLEGTARAVVNHNDFGITIPSVPSVANVDEAVALELDFVAVVATDATETPSS